jgi:radical SAM superfamily enzyme YgiQ (UPF0313 family)
MRPKLLIIAPSWVRGWWGGGKVLAPPLVLPLLAGLTPRNVDVHLVDENVEPVDTNTTTDWVAISFMTASALRAYEIGDAFRNRGIPVVMGGIHPTVLPDEAASHADAVVVGEAEPVWNQVLDDLAANTLKARYQSSEYCNMEGFPTPRRYLLKRNRYLTTNVIQTARGCPHGCSFCIVSTIFGKRYRFRPIPEVVDEILSTQGWLGFVDDNIIGMPWRAKELFEALTPLKRRWVGQGDLSMAKDPELMSLAVKSGCQAMFIGLESLSQKNLKDTHKRPNINLDMGQAITAIHRAGIEIIGSFVLGLDEDNRETIAETVDFAKRHKLAAAQFAVLTPFPGTAIREKLVSEGRVLDYDWSRYTMSKVVFRPLHMTEGELQQEQQNAYGRFYSFPSIIRRCFTLRGKVSLKIGVNFSYRAIRHSKGKISRRLPTS